MATSREYLQSVLARLAAAQNASDELLETPGVNEILKSMDELGDELDEVLN